MRKYALILVAVTGLVLPVSYGQGPNNPPVQKEEFMVEVAFYKGNPKGSVKKGDVRQVGWMRGLTPENIECGMTVGSKDVGGNFFGKKMTYQITLTQENCIEVQLETWLSTPATEKEGPTTHKNKQTQQLQLGGTIRLRMSPENKDCETWVELKIEKAK